MANGISKNPLLDINKVYLNQIAEGSLKSLEKASVLAMSDKPEDQDKAREIKTRFDYQSMLKQKKAKKVKEDVSNWRHDLREIIVTADKDAGEPEIKEKKIKNKITINPSFKEAVEELGGQLLTVEEVDDKKAEQMKKKEKMLKTRMLRMKLRTVMQTGGEDIVAGHEPEGEIIESRLKKVDECWKTHKQQGYKKKGGRMVPNCVPKNEEVEMTRKAYGKIHKDFKSDNPKKPRTTKYVPGKGTVSMPVKFVDEAKYEAGASTYGKASIRNKRRFGTKGENPDPLTGKKITKDATRGELITKRREEHKAKRGMKEEVGITTHSMMMKDFLLSVSLIS